MTTYEEPPDAVAALLVDELHSINAKFDAPEVRELIELVDEERTVSDQRNKLHKRIDRLYLASPLTPQEQEMLDELEDAEQWISRERRKLHQRIDEVRAGLGLPPWRHRYQNNEHDAAA